MHHCVDCCLLLASLASSEGCGVLLLCDLSGLAPDWFYHCAKFSLATVPGSAAAPQENWRIFTKTDTSCV